MDLGQAQTVRVDPLFRNPTEIHEQFYSATGPHGLVTRVTYTVPANRRAIISGVIADFLRTAVAAPASIHYATLYFWPSGGAAVRIRELYSGDNTLYNLEQIDVQFDMHLVAGDKIYIDCQNSDTGGAFREYMSIWGLEYDA